LALDGTRNQKYMHNSGLAITCQTEKETGEQRYFGSLLNRF